MPSAAAVAFGRGTDRLLLLFGDCWRDDLEINLRRKMRKRGGNLIKLTKTYLNAAPWLMELAARHHCGRETHAEAEADRRGAAKLLFFLLHC